MKWATACLFGRLRLLHLMLLVKKIGVLHNFVVETAVKLWRL
jgi:hypothetical protein